METRIILECDRPKFLEWEKWLEDRLPRLVKATERHSGTRLTAPLTIHLLTEKSYSSSARKHVNKEISRSGFNRLVTFGLQVAVALAWKHVLLADNSMAEWRDGQPAALHLTPDSHDRIYSEPAPDWFWEFVLIHELTHHAQHHAYDWSAHLGMGPPPWKEPEGPQLQFKAMIEGHADWVAYRWIEEAHPGCDPRKLSLSRHKPAPGPTEDLKEALDEYRNGLRFIRAVHEYGGDDLVRRLMSGAELVPTLEEVKDFSLWAERVGRP